MAATLRWVATVTLVGLPSLALAGTGGPPLCTNTCSTANDGKCDDLTTCAYGTDCADCSERTYALSPNITVCDTPAAVDDKRFHREIGYRLGFAMTPGANLKRRAACVPITCNVYPGCGADSCKEVPSCLPMGETALSDSMAPLDPDDFIFSVARPLRDLNVGLMPDSQMCSTAVSGSPWETRLPQAVLNTNMPVEAKPTMHENDYGLRNLKAVPTTLTSAIATSPKETGEAATKGLGAIKQVSQKLEKEDVMKYRCVILYEGDTCALTSAALGSGSLVFAPGFLTSECVTDLKPYVNYIPFNNSIEPLDLRYQLDAYCTNSSITVSKDGHFPAIPNTFMAPELEMYHPQDFRFPNPVKSPAGMRKHKEMHALWYDKRDFTDDRNTDVSGYVGARTYLFYEPSAVVSKVLQGASADAETLCDERREAQMKFQMLKRYQLSTVGRG